MINSPDEFVDDSFYTLPSLISIQEDIVEEEPQEFIDRERSFDENLALHLSDSVLNKIAGELSDGIDSDEQSRKDWLNDLEDSLDQLGFKTETKDKPFPNACGIYSSIMLQTIMEFFTVAVAELLPLEGPAKQLILGRANEELEKQANAVENHFNYFLTQEAVEYYPDMKKMLFWVGWTGMAIRKVYFDSLLNRPTSKFIKAQDLIVNYGTTCLSDCWRITHRYDMNANDYDFYIKDGKFKDVQGVTPEDETDEDNGFEDKLDRNEGLSRPDYDKKFQYSLHEIHTYLDLEDLEDEYASDENFHTNYRPYRITMHKETKKILSIYRNWKEGDDTYKRIEMFVEYGYFESLGGFYKLGASALIGGLAKACTTLQRQYIDGMTLANFPGGMHIKGMRLEDNNLMIGPTEFRPVDTGGLPIQDSIMLMPYKEPSPGINEMRKELEMSAARIMGAASQQLGDMSINPNVPLGTTYAFLDIINRQQSTVIRGLRDSMTNEFKIFYSLLSEVLPDEEFTFDISGVTSHISSQYYVPNIKMVPIADPHVTTKMQRIMRAQMLVDIAAQNPDLYDRYQVHKFYLTQTNLTDSQIDLVLPDKNNIPELDPISENVRIMNAKPVKAYLTQDHQAHIAVHQSIINPQGDQNMNAVIQAHIAEHSAMMYKIDMQLQLGFPIPEEDENVDVDLQNQIAMMASQIAMQQQQQNQEQAPPPLDPAMVMMEDVKVKAQALEQKMAVAELKAQSDSFKVQMENEAKMKELQIKMMELEHEMKVAQLDAEIKIKEMEARKEMAELNIQAKAFDSQLNYDAKLRERDEVVINQ